VSPNSDRDTIDSFGDEWSRFDQSALPEDESRALFDKYFSVFPWQALPANATGFDMGCGSGRWARWVAPRVGQLHCIDPSNALQVARKNLMEQDNIHFHQGGVDEHCLPSASQDFGYSLGVLHHIPDTAAAMRACVDMLKPGAPFLVYLYYAFDNRSKMYAAAWKASELLRWVVSSLPPFAKHFVTDVLAVSIYFPLARVSWLLDKLGVNVSSIPLSFYRNCSFYTMRTDSRDRFGTPLEQRYSRAQIETMMLGAGLADIVFSENAPYWCAMGIKK
jgi:2-polyprenyl-3-methyl-5-hydroxy-6-metoxy-1,4-benzoquinol methylase